MYRVSTRDPNRLSHSRHSKDRFERNVGSFPNEIQRTARGRIGLDPFRHHNTVGLLKMEHMEQ